MNAGSLNEFTHALKHGHELNKDQVDQCIDHLVSEKTLESEKISFLLSISKKGETENELSHFVSSFRSRSVNPELEEFAPHSVDLCGTGGDKAGSFNISTFVSFILASAGVPVIKHGNRSISSKCGSADLIEGIGIPLITTKEKLQEGMRRLGFGFLFAPQYHPSFKNIAPIRKKLAAQGTVTFFNLLGPMINPASPAYQLLGVYRPDYLERMGKALKKNHLESAVVVHGVIQGKEINGVDELTACGDNKAFGFGEVETQGVENWKLDKWGCEKHPFEHLYGGDLKENLKIMDAVLRRECTSGLLASIKINAATAFKICGKVKSFGEGMELAESLLVDGKVKSWVNQVETFFG